MKYNKKEILKAAEIGEVSMIDAKHICSLLDEARELLDEKQRIIDTIDGTDFQTRLKSAIECGVETDWYWDGKDENRIDTFNPDDAAKKVTELLKDYFFYQKTGKNFW